MEIPKFRTVQIPFTLYDFFGYLLPGITFGALMLLSFDVPKIIDVLTKKVIGNFSIPNYTYLFRDFIALLHESPWFISVCTLLISYIVGHFLAALSSYFLEKLLVQSWLQYPTENMFELRGKKKRYLFRNFRRAYTLEFIDKFKFQFESYFKLPLASSNDTFWITFEFVAHNCPATFARSIHFLNLYGFSRNLSMTFLTAGITLMYFEFTNMPTVHWMLVCCYFGISLILYWNYLKLLRRLNDEVYRGFYSFVTTVKLVAAAHNMHNNDASIGDE
jgi:hypothetical protein